MRLITVLNRCTTFKRFVFEGSHFDRHGRMMVRIRPRKNSRARAAAAVTCPPPMTRPPRPGCSSLFPSGGSRSFWCMACAGLPAKPAAGWSSRRSPGARASTTLPTSTAGGREVSPALVFPYDEKQHRTDERHRQDAAASSRAHPQLVQGQEAVQQRHCRGLEPEMESDGEKSIPDSAPSRHSKSLHSISLAIYPSHNSPTNSTDEPFNFTDYDIDLSSKKRGRLKTGASGYGYSLGMEAGRRIAFGENRNLIPRTWLVHTTGFRGQIHGTGERARVYPTADRFGGGFGLVAEWTPVWAKRSLSLPGVAGHRADLPGSRDIRSGIGREADLRSREKQPAPGSERHLSPGPLRPRGRDLSRGGFGIRPHGILRVPPFRSTVLAGRSRRD